MVKVKEMLKINSSIQHRFNIPFFHKEKKVLNSNTAIEEVIYVVRDWAYWLIFFHDDKVGEPITPLETQLRIKFMMHDRSQLSG